MCGKRIFVHYSGSFIKLCAGAVRNGNLDAGSASARTEGIWWLSYKAHPRTQFFSNVLGLVYYKMVTPSPVSVNSLRDTYLRT